MALSGSIKDAIDGLTVAPVLWDVPLHAWTSFRIGGPADGLVTIEGVMELQAVLALCSKEKIDWRIIGRGTNLLVADEGFRGMIIVLGEGFKKISRSEEYAGVGVKVKTGAAASLSVFTDWTAEQGLSGIEFAAGIPGSVGGAVAGNAGAWGTEISDVINRVYLADEKEIKIVQRKDLTFNYRCWKDLADSLNGFVITEVELTLANSSTSVVRKTMRELRISRQAKQPVGMPNAGSFFKNPENESAGRLIEGAGLKGVRVGGAEVSEKHANFLVNRGNATAADVIALMKEIQHRVEQKSGILLEPEVHFL